VYPGFESCDTVGTNHPVHPVHAFAVVVASSLQYQVLATSVFKDATIHAVPTGPLQIYHPPSILILPSGVLSATVGFERKN
jgi:hypothetical protein